MRNSCSDVRFFYCASNSERVLRFPSYRCFSISVLSETKDHFCFGFTVVETQIQKVIALNEFSSIHRSQGKVLPGEKF